MVAPINTFIFNASYIDREQNAAAAFVGPAQKSLKSRQKTRETAMGLGQQVRKNENAM
jgi:hypothetical protein